MPPAEFVAELSGGQKVMRRAPRMRACSQLDAKGKHCMGHLKRWYGAGPELISAYGAEIYRCEKCKTIYLPNPAEAPRTRTLAW
jgi:hypothetical protein